MAHRLSRETNYLQIQCNPIKTPAAFFVGIDKLILKCIWKLRGPRIAGTALQKRSNVGGLALSSVKPSYTSP